MMMSKGLFFEVVLFGFRIGLEKLIIVVVMVSMCSIISY